jgi:hypothetical protein
LLVRILRVVLAGGPVHGEEGEAALVGIAVEYLGQALHVEAERAEPSHVLGFEVYYCPGGVREGVGGGRRMEGGRREEGGGGRRREEYVVEYLGQALHVKTKGTKPSHALGFEVNHGPEGVRERL